MLPNAALEMRYTPPNEANHSFATSENNSDFTLMKETLLISLLGCGIAMADINPVVHLTFDGNDLLANAAGNSGYVVNKLNGYDGGNSTAVLVANGADYLGDANGAALYVGNEAFVTISGAGLDLSKSFTLTFVAKASDAILPWYNIFGVRTSSSNERLQNTSNGLFPTVLGNDTDIRGEALSTSSYTRITLVYEAEKTTNGNFTLYQDGASIADWTTTLGSSGAVSLDVGGFYQSKSFDGWIDEVGVYDVALTAEEVLSLNGTASGTIARADAIPEPTTATLSLLALAGLAARRRRK